MAASSSVESLAEQIVDAMRALAGPHPGYRPVHAKGVVCTGTFIATEKAQRVCRASHFDGKPVAATIRFANADGNPKVHDGLPNVRSLSVKFTPAKGGKTDILANSIEGFAVRTPEDLLEFLRARLPDPADPAAVPRFLESHPAARAYVEWLAQKPVPASYAQATYHAAHAFRFTSADGESRFGRYRWIPDAGEEFLTPEQAGKRNHDFLLEELTARLGKGPVSFRLNLQIAERGDPTDDATALWPVDRARVELGRLQIDAISPTSAADERGLVFDPTNLTDGIELSADPLPRMRSAAYSVSYEQRSK
jgi:catalase